MNGSLRLFVIGFLIGLPLFCYLGLKSYVPTAASAETAAPKPVGHQPTPIPQPKKQRSVHARRPQQKTAVAASPSPAPDRKRVVDRQLAKAPPSSDERSKRTAVAREQAVDQSKRKDGGSKDAQKPAGERSVRPSRDTRRQGAAPSNVPPADQNRPCQIRLKRILVGEEVLTNRVFPESALDEQAKHGKYVVYFELSISNQAQRSDLTVSFRDFRLEDSAGLIYSPLRTDDCLSAILEPGKTARGGVAFAMYNDAAPARLLFRTGQESFTPLPESLFWGGGPERNASP